MAWLSVSGSPPGRWGGPETQGSSGGGVMALGRQGTSRRSSANMGTAWAGKKKVEVARSRMPDSCS